MTLSSSSYLSWQADKRTLHRTDKERFTEIILEFRIGRSLTGIDDGTKVNKKIPATKIAGIHLII